MKNKQFATIWLTALLIALATIPVFSAGVHIAVNQVTPTASATGGTANPTTPDVNAAIPLPSPSVQPAAREFPIDGVLPSDQAASPTPSPEFNITVNAIQPSSTPTPAVEITQPGSNFFADAFNWLFGSLKRKLFWWWH